MTTKPRAGIAPGAKCASSRRGKRPETAAPHGAGGRAKKATVKSGTRATASPPDGRPHERARQRREALLAVTDDVRRSPEGKGRAHRSATGSSRKGKKTITIFLHPIAKSLIDAISYENGISVQDLGIEAVNLLLVAYDRKPIA